MASEAKNKIVDFFEALGFTLSNFDGRHFTHYIQFSSKRQSRELSIPIDYYYLPSQVLFNKEEVFDIHRRIWNGNSIKNFIICSDNETLIFNARVKPDIENPKAAIIHKIAEGVETEKKTSLNQIVSKNSLDSGYFFDFVIQKRNQKREQEVDKDLLLNLIALRQDLLIHSNQPKVVDLLILRCLFLKYLEDRGIYQPYYLSGILESKDAKRLIDAFEEVRKINGDIFKDDILAEDQIKIGYLDLLARFFRTDYRSGQIQLFPYRFDHIPIQLISNVYEAFLDNAKKQGKGIYYTPKFVVDFMLGRAFQPILEKNRNLTVFDPSCGSGAFLVEAYKQIVKRKNAEKDFEEKKHILESQIFGIDIDNQALQIATFSLYLALLEGLDPRFVKYQIENQAPILPSLVGKNLICGNTITQNEVFESQTFDCIIGNPPWGSVPNDNKAEHKKERQVIGSKGKKGTEPEYENVSDYQRSQAFLLRVKKWAHEKTSFALIVNNAIFLNENAKDFRQELLRKYQVKEFYELSNLNKILFRKRIIGKIKNKTIEIGATEPCAVIVFTSKSKEEYIIKYITPKLNRFSEAFNLIHFTDYDQKLVRNLDLLIDDLIWRVFVNGNWEDYQLIVKAFIERKKDVEIECRSGFQPKKNMNSEGTPEWRQLVTPNSIFPFLIIESDKVFNWNQKLHRRRDENIFQGERIVLPVRPLGKDKLRLQSARLLSNEVFKHNVLCVKIKENQIHLKNYAPYLGILNSSFIGYYLYNISAQWGKGDLKRSTFRNVDIEKLPLPGFYEQSSIFIELDKVVTQIEANKKQGLATEDLESEVDELVFDAYNLLDFEKEIIREFYDINVHRKNDKVKLSDLQKYANKFREIYELVLDDNFTLDVTYKISPNFGAFLSFSIIEKQYANYELKTSNINDSELFHLIKSNQLEEAFYANRLNEVKTKLYEENRFFLIKSNFFKDWTVRKAINDANEEIKLLTHEPILNE